MHTCVGEWVLCDSVIVIGMPDRLDHIGQVKGSEVCQTDWIIYDRWRVRGMPDRLDHIGQVEGQRQDEVKQYQCC